MSFNPNIYHRKSIRLKGYDYSQAGLYFITICVQNRECLFGKIVDGEMILNDAGQIANECWLNIPEHFPHAVLHQYVVMPNHIHGIIELVVTNMMVGANNYSPKMQPCRANMMVGANNYSPLRTPQPTPLRSPSKTIGSIVRGYKIGVTKWFRIHSDIDKIWQHNYYENIIRDEQSHHRISEYIINNPTNWKGDTFHPF